MIELGWNYHMSNIFVKNNRIARTKAQQNKRNKTW